MTTKVYTTTREQEGAEGDAESADEGVANEGSEPQSRPQPAAEDPSEPGKEPESPEASNDAYKETVDHKFTKARAEEKEHSLTEENGTRGDGMNKEAYGEAETGGVSTTDDDKAKLTTDGEAAAAEATTPNTMALNVAYEALEQVRQANAAIEFGREIGPKECVCCLREPKPSTGRFRMPKLNRAAPCLTCGTPVCTRHRCPKLKRENINICVECATFFSLNDFVKKIHSSEDAELRRQEMNDMLDVYDRALLILQYSSQYIEEIAASLEHNTKRNNQIGLGTSATGFVSGIAGVAAAGLIFTPAGPPLLIASILFGGGATAASASSEAVNYHCSANKMADTIYALDGMVHSISRLAIEGHLWGTDDEVPQDGTDSSIAPTNQRTHKAQARNWTRATANALKPLTAGALSAASVVMEAREMRSTLDKINAGSPCDKAESLRKIASEMDYLPATTLLAEIAPRSFKLD